MPLVNTYINETQLYHDLKKMDRDNFSYDGAKALMEYLDDLSEDIGENIEYDPIAFCCDYSEYCESEYEQLASEYNNAPEPDDFDDESEFHNALLEWLSEQTSVIHFPGGIIIQAF